MSIALRRHGVTVALLIVAIALAAYLALCEGAESTSDRGRSPAPARNLLAEFRPLEVTAVTLVRPEATVHFARQRGDAGEIAYSLGDELADPSAVDKLLRTLEFATWERRVSGGVDRAALGLVTPRETLRVVSGKQTREILLGAAAPSPPGAAYLEVLGEGVYVVGRDLVAELDKEPSRYRDRALLPFALSEIASLSWEPAAGGYALTRGPWGGFALTRSGHLVRADRAVIERLMSALADLRAESFLSPEQAEARLDAAPDRVRLRIGRSAKASDRDRSNVVIEFGAHCPDSVASAVAIRREPKPITAACIGAGVLTSLALNETELQDRRLFTLRTDEIEQIRLSSGSGAVELARVGTGWHARAPSETAVGNEVGQGLATDLVSLVADELVSPPASPGDAAQGGGHAELTRTQAGAGLSATEALTWGAPDGDSLLVHRLEDGVWLRVSRDTLDVLEPGASALRSRRVIDVAADTIERVTIAGGGVNETLAREPGGVYALERPGGYAVDAEVAHDLGETLAHLSCDRWASAQATTRAGLESPSARYEMVAGGTRFDIELGRRTWAGTYARRVGDDGIFVLSDPTRAALEVWAIDRSLLMLDPSQVGTVAVQRGARRLILKREADAGVPHNEKLAVVLEALSEARALGVVHVGAPRAGEGFTGSELRVVAERAAPDYRIAIGAEGSWGGARIVYARRAGVDATFAVDERQVRPLLDLELSAH